MSNFKDGYGKGSTAMFRNSINLSLPERLPFSSKKKFSENLPDFVVNEKKQEKEIPFFNVDVPFSSIENKDLQPFQKKGPIFIRTDDYSKMLDCVSSMKEYVDESPDIVMMLKNLKKNSDFENRKYVRILEDIQRKLIYIDNLLFEAMKE